MSSYKNNTYIVFLDLPNWLSINIDSVKKNFGNNYKKWEAHITFKQDEDFNFTAKEAIKIVESYFKEKSEYQITINKPEISFFDDNWNIYLPITKNTRLSNDIKKYSKLIEKYIDPKSPNAYESTKWEQSVNFYPHISLKGGKVKNAGRAIYEKISKSNFDFKFPRTIQIKSITLAKWKLTQWKKIKTIQLL